MIGRRRCGLTLIELVVALTVAGLVTTAGYAALSRMTETRQRAMTITDATVRTAATRRSLREWLAGARLTVEGSVELRGLDGQRDHAAAAEITLLTTAPTPLGDCGVRGSAAVWTLA